MIGETKGQKIDEGLKGRIEFSLSGMSPAQRVFLAGRLCLEASRRMGVGLEGKKEE